MCNLMQVILVCLWFLGLGLSVLGLTTRGSSFTRVLRVLELYEKGMHGAVVYIMVLVCF